MAGLEDFYTDGRYLRNKPTWDVDHSAWKADVIAGILSGDPRPGRVAEVGCGAGEVLRRLGIAFGDGCTCDGFDISPDAIALARARAGSGLRFHLGGVEALADGGYDVAVAADVVEHVENPFEFLRVLRRKARLLVMILPLDMNVDYLLRPRKLLGLRADVGHVHYFSRETGLALLADSGYEVVRTRLVNMHLDRPPRGAAARVKLWAKQALLAAFPTLTPRLLGGFSLLVVARPRA